jgi:UDP-4-amino-4,6-dideoxy-N-acetyl-beta-L-altrosamine N-acetyltransferase
MTAFKGQLDDTTLTIRLTPFAELCAEQAELVWRMRTHPAVAEWMTNPGPIPWEAHLAFMARQADDLANLNLLATDEAGAAGVVALHNRSGSHDSAELGIYRNPFRTERGLGRRLLRALHDFAFSDPSLTTITLRVHRDNAPACHLYRSEGYAEAGADADPRFVKMALQRNVYEARRTRYGE